METARSHSTQIAPIKNPNNLKVIWRNPRNITAVETRMWYQVTEPPQLTRSVDTYSGRWIDNFAARYHTMSTQSGLNSHEMYLGMFLRVSQYDPRRKRLHKNQHRAFWLLNVTYTRKTNIHSRVLGMVTFPFWLNTAFTVPIPSGIEKTMKRYGDIFGCHRSWERVGS